MKFAIRLFLSGLLALSTIGAGAAGAQALFNQTTAYANATFHTGVAGAGDARIAAMRLELKQGWKTYWRIPGDSGLPPHFDWAGSENIADVAVTWPVPKVFDGYNDRTIGYVKRMVVPLTLTPEDPGLPMKVRLRFSYGVCAEICIPAAQEFAVDIEPDAAADGGYFIERAMADRIVPAGADIAEARHCTVEGTGGKRTFRAALAFAVPFTTPPLIVAEADDVWFGRIETRLEGDLVVASGRAEMPADKWLTRDDIRLTVIGEGRGLVFPGCAAR